MDFDAIIDHLALTHIIKCKMEAVTTRIKRLLELISFYSSNLFYMKGRDMILNDFLSWQNNDDSNLHEIIPISFNMSQILDENYYNERYLIQTRSQTKSSGTKLLKVHGTRKNLDPNLKPEKQLAMPQNGSMERPHIDQGRAASRRKRPEPINQSINKTSNLSQKNPGRTEIETRKTNDIHSKNLTHSINNTNGKLSKRDPLIPDVPFHPGPVYKPPPEPIKQNVSYPKSSQGSTNIDNINPNFYFKENCPFQEGIMSETFQRLDKSFFQEPKELSNLIKQEHLIHKYLPKQTDIDKMLEVIQRKVLKGTHLPVKIKEIQAGYLHSPYLDIYLYLLENRLPSSKALIKRVEAIAEKYILLESLLFKINFKKKTAVLEVPEGIKELLKHT